MGLTKLIPPRSVIAGGLTGLTAWGILLVANYYGVQIDGSPISYDVACGLATVLGGIVTHLVPDSVKDHARALNVSVEDLAKVIPTTQAVYPEGKNGGTIQQPTQSNQAWKDK